jgi:hypothetical protein
VQYLRADLLSFNSTGHKRSIDDNEIDQRDPAYYNHVYMATDKNKNDLIVPLSKGTEVHVVT